MKSSYITSKYGVDAPENRFYPFRDGPLAWGSLTD